MLEKETYNFHIHKTYKTKTICIFCMQHLFVKFLYNGPSCILTDWQNISECIRNVLQTEYEYRQYRIYIYVKAV